MSKLRLKQLAQDTAATGNAIIWNGTAWAPAPASGGLGWFDVTAYGAVHDGTTDDTTAVQTAIDACATAGGGVVYFPHGVYKINGALQDTSGANSQLLLPAKDYVDDEQITIVLMGEAPPPPIVSVIGTTPIPDNGSVIKSTLGSGTGALLGGWGPAGTYSNFTNILLVLRNLTFRMPANPTNTALDLRKVAAIDVDQVVIDAGSYYVQGLTQPSTSTSFGLRTPGIDNGACTHLGVVNVIGFYKGYEFGEHSNGEQIAAWGCVQAFVFVTGYHASKFQRLMPVHCQRGIVVTGDHYFDVDQYNIEHAASGWWVTAYDIDDASNLGHGTVRWHVVLAGVGVSRTFTVNGATNLRQIETGYDPIPSTYADPLTTKGDLLTHSATVTARLGVGTDGQVVTADSTATNGIKWATPATSSPGAGELLMQDGVSAPPVPIENEARTDWLYQD